MKNVIQNIAATVTDEPIIRITKTPKDYFGNFIFKRKWLYNIFLFFGHTGFEKDIKIKSLSLGTMYRISRLVMSIELKKPSKELNDWAFDTIKNNAYTISEIVATAIHNRKSDVPESLIRWVFESFTPSEINIILRAIKEDIDIGNFMSSISSIRSLNLMAEDQLSPADTGEIIAPGQQ